MMRSALSQRNQTLYSAIAGANSQPLLAQTLFEIAAVFGYPGTTLMIMPAKTDRSVAGLVLESNMAPDFHRSLDVACPPNTCQMYSAIRRSILPQTWSVQQIERQHMIMNAPEPPVLDLYRQYGISGGILLPLTAIDGTRHVVRLDGDRAAAMQEETNDLLMLCMHFFDSYDRARYRMGDNPLGLTERELDVVRWSATGKTSAEIGMILSLSDHTINAYMNNALKKLDCVNRTQLVAKALRMRIIS
jgi:DNA-binding CsgD family transcriptional regulator